MKYGKRFGGGGIEKRPGAKHYKALWDTSYVAGMSGPVRHIDPAELNAKLAQARVTGNPVDRCGKLAVGSAVPGREAQRPAERLPRACHLLSKRS